MTQIPKLAAALALVAALVVPALAQGPGDDLSTAPRIAVAAFKRLLQLDQVMVIDVRDAESYRLGHIPGAVLIPLEELPAHVAALKASTKPIVTYCA
jgi:predicted sulfurtransferase